MLCCLCIDDVCTGMNDRIVASLIAMYYPRPSSFFLFHVKCQFLARQRLIAYVDTLSLKAVTSAALGEAEPTAGPHDDEEDHHLREEKQTVVRSGAPCKNVKWHVKWAAVPGG
jgi:hypothetical protein